ncbi:carbohydrate-binding module family 24 protein [Sporormia fimetaria CBS 119925]|uniref:chitinase n=1 Tax=Sporormia fimetaria CBS 119925 TaxID=1340428 RepID=A0A6A6UYX3_9PLEO|nr:carbohydrate-binding module family 24 protein [Sporormia fimetaria CBS 119925]
MPLGHMGWFLIYCAEIRRTRRPSDCPAPCVDYSNTHSWTPYFSIRRLDRCQDPLLLQFSVTESLYDPKSDILIRTCSLGSGIAPQPIEEVPIENPKKAEALHQSSLDTAPACRSPGVATSRDLLFSTNNGHTGGNGYVLSLLNGMKSYFVDDNNCDGNILFAFNNGTVAGLYVGSNLGKPTISTALDALWDRLQNEGLSGNQTSPNTYVCCSAGDPYTPPKPQPNPDGTCATHLIVQNDDCSKIGNMYGVTVEEIEEWNRGTTWAWTQCGKLLLGYNMCVSEGTTPLPPPQAGTACGPLVPGTKPPAAGESLADLNPCPLNACCSHWGFCGVFPGHCGIHAPEDGGPGSKLEGFQNTCVSNCGNDIKMNSGPPEKFSRVGYYGSYNFNRKCLWMNAKNANTDGTYTHMHWGFADIDPDDFTVIITDPGNQWEEFKKLDLKRIISLGGWAYSTEAATYNILRRAIIDNRDTFARNLADFAEEHSIDGIDIDWEYPGAPDIMVDGRVIGKETDGADYLEFLKVLKSYLGTKSVSIAAPASYWYLKAFPIDEIAAEIDYIVYMTYDLHGQWDYGNPHSFDQCDSGKCLRSHVNLTETINALSMITKAGVPNKKIFVGEASYGRSFRMAINGAFGPLDDFTGTRLVSDANPGRCTNAPGYLALAEINELVGKSGAMLFYDRDAQAQILLYDGDYVSYTTREQMDDRRDMWLDMSIDWAVDLQGFGIEDIKTPLDVPEPGETGCTSGEDISLQTGDLCEYTCQYGYCPEEWCFCTETGKVPAPPSSHKEEYQSLNGIDVELSRMCNFACKRNYCPLDKCEIIIIEDGEEEEVEEEEPKEIYPNARSLRDHNTMNCYIYRDKTNDAAATCQKPCQSFTDAAAEEGRISNYGCYSFYPGAKEIPWIPVPGENKEMTVSRCQCDSWVVNEIADFVMEAMPLIAQASFFLSRENPVLMIKQIGCVVLMSSFKLVLDVGLSIVPGGRIVDAGLDMLATGVQMANYLYDEDNDPPGAFSWWLSLCGDPALIPEDILTVFDILGSIGEGMTSFKKPKKLQKGSGKKGDEGNPTEATRGKVRPGTTKKSPNPIAKKKKCDIKAAMRERRMINTIRYLNCDAQDQTQTTDWIIESLSPVKGAQTLQTITDCGNDAPQACYHYSSAIKVNPQWATLTCPPEAISSAWRYDFRGKPKVTDIWNDQHAGAGWLDSPHYPAVKANLDLGQYERDEFPPAYLLNANHDAVKNAGINTKGQLMWYIPANQNKAGGRLWKGACFKPLFHQKIMEDANFKRQFNADLGKVVRVNPKKRCTESIATATADYHPEFVIGWAHDAPPADPDWHDGEKVNPCWDSTRAPEDPGLPLLTYGAAYDNNMMYYDYMAPYGPGVNGG